MKLRFTLEVDLTTAQYEMEFSDDMAMMTPAQLPIAVQVVRHALDHFEAGHAEAVTEGSATSFAGQPVLNGKMN